MPSPDATELPGPSGTRFASIQWFDTIDSTNRYLLEAARATDANGLVAVADVQTAGRGRLGRTWQAEAGASLLVSVLLRPTLAVEDWPLVLGPAGLAAVETLTTVCDLPARLKWPNDVVVRDLKIAGLLAEASGDALVVGMGLNVEWSELPDDIAATATAVNLAGGRVQSRRLLLDVWLRNLERWLTVLERGPRGRAVVQHAQRRVSATLGRRVRVERSDDAIVGLAVDLDHDGHLLVRDDNGVVHATTTGDVVHLRPADDAT